MWESLPGSESFGWSRDGSIRAGKWRANSRSCQVRSTTTSRCSSGSAGSAIDACRSSIRCSSPAGATRSSTWASSSATSVPTPQPVEAAVAHRRVEVGRGLSRRVAGRQLPDPSEKRVLHGILRGFPIAHETQARTGGGACNARWSCGCRPPPVLRVPWASRSRSRSTCLPSLASLSMTDERLGAL